MDAADLHRLRFLREAAPELAEFEEIYAQQGWPGMAPGPPQLPWQEAWREGPQGSEPLQPFLRAFLDSSKAQGGFAALPQPRVCLSSLHVKPCLLQTCLALPILAKRAGFGSIQTEHQAFLCKLSSVHVDQVQRLASVPDTYQSLR